MPAGTLSVDQGQGVGVNLSSTTPTSMTLNYTREIYRFTSPGLPIASGTLCTVPQVTGAVTASFVATAPAALTPYWFREKVTAGNGATSEGNEVMASLWSRPVKFGWVGDSNIQGYGGPNLILRFEELASFAYAPRVLVGTSRNYAAAGSKTTDWTPGNARLTNSIADFAANSVTDVILMLGTNDVTAGTTVSDYRANIVTIARAYADAGFRVWVYGPFYSTFGTRPQTCWLYRQSITDIDETRSNNMTIRFVNDTSYCQILASYATGRTAMLSDGTHVDPAWADEVGDAMFRGYDAKLNAGSYTPATGGRWGIG